MHDPNSTVSLSGFFKFEVLDVRNIGREEERR